MPRRVVPNPPTPPKGNPGSPDSYLVAQQKKLVPANSRAATPPKYRGEVAHVGADSLLIAHSKKVPPPPQFTDGLKDADKSEATETQLEAALKTEDGRAELKKLFDSMDSNKDGVLSSKEWGNGVTKHKDVIAKFFGGATIEEIGRQFARIDADSNKELSWDEMLAAAGIKA